MVPASAPVSAFACDRERKRPVSYGRGGAARGVAVNAQRREIQVQFLAQAPPLKYIECSVYTAAALEGLLFNFANVTSPGYIGLDFVDTSSPAKYHTASTAGRSYYKVKT